MPFVKLDCGILNSTIWFEREAREVFITALLMAEPFELKEPAEQIETTTLNSTGWMVPPGWYGIVQAAGRGIINRAGIQDETLRIAALELLAKPEETSLSREFDGRRMVRVNGGFIVLNYMKYRDRDYTARDRQRRLRERRKALRRDVTPSRRNVTHSREQKAEADTESRSQSAETRTAVAPSALVRVEPNGFATFWSAYPNRKGKQAAMKAWRKLSLDATTVAVIHSALTWQTQQQNWKEQNGRFVPHASTWLNNARWQDEPFEPLNRSDPNKAAWDRVKGMVPNGDR